MGDHAPGIWFLGEHGLSDQLCIFAGPEGDKSKTVKLVCCFPEPDNDHRAGNVDLILMAREMLVALEKSTKEMIAERDCLYDASTNDAGEYSFEDDRQAVAAMDARIDENRKIIAKAKGEHSSDTPNDHAVRIFPEHAHAMSARTNSPRRDQIEVLETLGGWFLREDRQGDRSGSLYLCNDDRWRSASTLHGLAWGREVKNLTDKDIGRKVIYIGGPDDKGGPAEESVIAYFNDQHVFVRSDRPKHPGPFPVKREDLRFSVEDYDAGN